MLCLFYPFSLKFYEGMLAIARSLAPELARGLSTSLALLANRQACPDCLCSPTLQCAQLPKPADCVCESNQRLCAVTDSCPDPVVHCVIAFLSGVIVGATLCIYVAYHCGLLVRPVATSPIVSSSTIAVVEEHPIAHTSPAAIALQRLKDKRNH